MSNGAVVGASSGSDSNRQVVRTWGERYWQTTCAATFFRWKRFTLRFTARQEVGTYPVWLRIIWVLGLPVLMIYGVIRYLLYEFGVISAKPTRAPGVVYVEGKTNNSSAISLIDSVKRAQRPLWLVFSRSRLAVVAMSSGEPRVVWQTDEAASIRFDHDVQNSVEVTWPDDCHASFDLTPEEGEYVRQFLERTTENERRFR